MVRSDGKMENSDRLAIMFAFVTNPYTAVYIDEETSKCFGRTARKGFTLNTIWRPIKTEPVFVNI